MNYRLLLRTVRHLKMTQMVNQILYRVHKAKYVQSEAPNHRILKLAAGPIPRYKGISGKDFTFLNLTHKFTDWNFVGNGTLFTYNQNYFDFINDNEVVPEEACKLIDRFIKDRPNITWGLDPYPIALRGINWIKFFCHHPECTTKEREDSLWSQYKLLEKKLEYHLLGNHLLENSYSLYISGCYFDDNALRNKGYKLLIEQLKEQTLNDGAHYEQSPMYHCILLDRLLDCINVGLATEIKTNTGNTASADSETTSALYDSVCLSESEFSTVNQNHIAVINNGSLSTEVKYNKNSLSPKIKALIQIAEKQLGWLEAFCYKDGSWPFFNDAALGIAPTSDRIFDYAKRLGLIWSKGTLGVSGYRKLTDGNFELIADVGNITATYQAGHTHADTTNYELRIDGKPIVIDTGISTYDKTPRRQYERSSVAHNMVVKEGATTDSSCSCYEVWGGFRVAGRCKTTILKDTPNELIAEHNGYGKLCRRRWSLDNECLTVEDFFEVDAVSYIHLAAGVDPERVKIEGADKVEILDTKYSVEYNHFIDNKTIAIHFHKKVIYSIS